MSVENILNRLEKVRKTGVHKWIACCPAHGDKHPSLAIREIEDGRTLLHCFAGCEAGEVITAMGLTFADLFPENLNEAGEAIKPVRKPWIAADILRCLALESLIILQCGSRLNSGAPLSNEDSERLKVAVSRVHAAERICNED